MTDKNEIQILLDKFLLSESTLEEERLLKTYFCSHDDIPEEWIPYAVLFKGFANKDSRLRSVKKKRALSPWIYAIAASVIIVFLFVMYHHDAGEVPEVKNEIVLVKTEPQSSLPTIIQSQATKQSSVNTGVESSRVDNIVKISVQARTEKKECSQPQHPTTTSDDAANEMSDEELMAEYIANNFMTLDERLKIQEAEAFLETCQNNLNETQENINGSRIVETEDYDY